MPPTQSDILAFSSSVAMIAFTFHLMAEKLPLLFLFTFSPLGCIFNDMSSQNKIINKKCRNIAQEFDDTFLHYRSKFNINICAFTVSVVVQHIEGLIYNKIGIVIETLLYLSMRGKSLLPMAFRENCNQLS